MRFEENDDDGLMTCGHYLTHIGPWFGTVPDGLWFIRLKLSPTTTNINIFPLGVEYICKFIKYVLVLLTLLYPVRFTSGRDIPNFQPGQVIIIDKVHQQAIPETGEKVGSAIDPPILRFTSLDDIDFNRRSDGKYIITDDFGHSLAMDSFDEPVYRDLKQLLREDLTQLYSNGTDNFSDDHSQNRPPPIPQYKIEDIHSASEYFSIRYKIQLHKSNFLKFKLYTNLSLLYL